MKILQQLKKKKKNPKLQLELHYLLMPFTMACMEGNLSWSFTLCCFCSTMRLQQFLMFSTILPQNHSWPKGTRRVHASTCVRSWSAIPIVQPCTPGRLSGLLLCGNSRASSAFVRKKGCSSVHLPTVGREAWG